MPRIKTVVSSTANSSTTYRPALTPEARENEMIALSMNLVRERLLNGTASSQETTHFLKIAATRERERVEMEILEKQKELLEAKTESLKKAQRIEELYTDAIKAFTVYSGGELNNEGESEQD